MKTIILYTTKTGTVQKCVQRLKDLLGADAADLARCGCALASYDTVILGGSIRMGRVQKPLRRFMAVNEAVLIQKRLGLFLCSAFTDQANMENYFRANFPQRLRTHALICTGFGGELEPDRLTGMDRLVAGMVTKLQGTGGPPVRLDNAAIAHFAQEMQTGSQNGGM